jgi:hypothetical protein
MYDCRCGFINLKPGHMALCFRIGDGDGTSLIVGDTTKEPNFKPSESGRESAGASTAE